MGCVSWLSAGDLGEGAGCCTLGTCPFCGKYSRKRVDWVVPMGSKVRARFSRSSRRILSPFPSLDVSYQAIGAQGSRKPAVISLGDAISFSFIGDIGPVLIWASTTLANQRKYKHKNWMLKRSSARDKASKPIQQSTAKARLLCVVLLPLTLSK